MGMERAMGIEPTLSAWKAEVLPLNYARIFITYLCLRIIIKQKQNCLSKAGLSQLSNSVLTMPISMSLLVWRGKDSNLRRQSRQIYSLIPLTAREPLLK